MTTSTYFPREGSVAYRVLELPPPTRRRIDWPSVFVRMAPGDSFALPARAKSSIAKAITDDKKATGREFATSLVDGGIRVWRVS